MNGVIGRVNSLIKHLGVTPNAFAKKVGLGSSNLVGLIGCNTVYRNLQYSLTGASKTPSQSVKKK